MSARPSSGPPTSGAPSSGAPLSSAPGSASSTANAAPTATATTTLPQTIGISPAQPPSQTGFTPIGIAGSGGESYDLQSQIVYGLLEQRGVYDQRGIPHLSVLDPQSTAKPSFIIERLIVLNTTGASAKSGGGNSAPSSAPSSATGAPNGAGGASTSAQVSAPTDAGLTISAVRRVVDAEISRGSGRIGGTHRRKLLLLRAALRSLEEANKASSAASTTTGGGARGNAAPSSGQGGNSSTQTDPREAFYGYARRYARIADQLVPTGY